MADGPVEVNYSASEGLTLRFKPSSLKLIPEPTRQHIRAANKELLLALRSFVDQAIEGMGPEEGEKKGPQRVHVRDGNDEEISEGQ